MLKSLLDQITSITADGTYDTVDCYDVMLKGQAEVIIPSRSNAVLCGKRAKLGLPEIMLYQAAGIKGVNSGNVT